MTAIESQTDALTIVVQPPAPSLGRAPRVEGRYRVRYRLGDEEWTTRLCLNVSKGGLFVATQTNYEAGTLLYVELYDGDRWLRARTRVQWTRSGDTDAQAPAGMGLQVLAHHFADESDWNALVEREQAPAVEDAQSSCAQMAVDVAGWFVSPEEGAAASFAAQSEPVRVREAVMLVGMSVVSMGLLLIR